MEARLENECIPQSTDQLSHPDYLEKHYWWAYLHPWGVAFFDHLPMVNAILFGQFNKIKQAALDAMGQTLHGNILQVTAVYGDITPKLCQRLAEDAKFSLIDIAPIQLKNVAKKLPQTAQIQLSRQDSTNLQFADQSQDQVLVFFLLHEQPDDVKKQTLKEAWRVLKTGGRLTIAEYHNPKKWSWIRPFLIPALKVLEPFTLSLWHKPLPEWLPKTAQFEPEVYQTFLMGQYQLRSFIKQ